ncbi:PTS system mannose/fructose/N-acetylgalactosamine-transporter subunit IIB [Amphibacillus sp. Q70]|uniref:PTS system mannose/fructose/N-acetylgalactosamine-transporter subunit IIB n=1 Tax=Amphibacillus sp. Q70 TaxID=3453416 RepID=UPI003F828834
MKGIIHIRVDDRLIHGQVATQWVNHLGATRIMVINDEIATNDIQKRALRIAAPPNVSSSIITKQTAATNILSGKYDGQKVLIVLKSPNDVVDLLNLGLNIKKINLGNLSVREGTHRILPTISVTNEEEESLKELINKEIEVTAIMVPGDSKVYVKDIL